MAADVEIEIAAHAAAGEHPDRARRAFRRARRVLHRLPGALQELAVLRIHDGGVLRAEAEELRIEVRHARQLGRAWHIVAPPDARELLARRRQLLHASGLDRISTPRRRLFQNWIAFVAPGTRRESPITAISLTPASRLPSTIVTHTPEPGHDAILDTINRPLSPVVLADSSWARPMHLTMQYFCSIAVQYSRQVYHE